MKFLGSHTHRVDGKGRVSLPAPFRRAAADEEFVLVHAYPAALALYPETEWAVVEERLTDLLRHQPESRMFVLNVTANAVEVEPDGQGRILIPASLRDAAELDGEALLVGAIHKIEIWNPERFEESSSEKADAYDRFAPQIFR